MKDDVDGARQAWRVPCYADLSRSTQQLVDDVTATNDRLRLAHTLAIAREILRPSLPIPHDCR